MTSVLRKGRELFQTQQDNLEKWIIHHCDKIKLFYLEYLKLKI